MSRIFLHILQHPADGSGHVSNLEGPGSRPVSLGSCSYTIVFPAFGLPYSAGVKPPASGQRTIRKAAHYSGSTANFVIQTLKRIVCPDVPSGPRENQNTKAFRHAGFHYSGCLSRRCARNLLITPADFRRAASLSSWA